VRAAAGDGMRRVVARFTSNRLAGVATGTVATTVLDSSSVTIMMAIALVDAQVLTFAQSVGVVMGANIGTTVSSQIVAFDVSRYAPVALVVGFLAHMLARGERTKHVGLAVFGLGLIFFGLELMGDAVEPLKESPRAAERLARLASPVLGVAAGALCTVVLQSSSATLGIVITLAGQGLLTLPAAVAVMLGAEIGTCADTLVATVGRSRAAVRTGVFHLLFNVGTVALGIALIGPLAGMARATAGAGDLRRQVANAHLLFNVLGVVAAVWFVPAIERALRCAVPDERDRPVPEVPAPAPA
jgi:phosphate:Na+ symporter